MSKNSRKKKKNQRDAMKRARKRAATAQYQAWAAEGINTKSKRAQRNKEANQKVRVHRNRRRSKVMVEFAQHNNVFHNGTIRRIIENKVMTQKQFRNTMTLKQFLRTT